MSWIRLSRFVVITIETPHRWRTHRRHPAVLAPARTGCTVNNYGRTSEVQDCDDPARYRASGGRRRMRRWIERQQGRRRARDHFAGKFYAEDEQGPGQEGPPQREEDEDRQRDHHGAEAQRVLRDDSA